MAVIDFILNLAALLLWINWRSVSLDILHGATPGTFIGTLKRAETSRTHRWQPLIVLLVLLFLRAVIYWQVGSAVRWSPSLSLDVISVSFRADFFQRMLLYSALSFFLALLVFHLWLIFLSALNHRNQGDPVQRLVNLHLGMASRLPTVIKLILPFFLGGCLWAAAYPLLSRLNIIPKVASGAHLFQQSVLMGIEAFLAWRYLIAILLFLFLLNSYIYMGNHSFWNFVTLTSRNLLAPFQRLPLRIGRVDFAPVIVIALTFLIGQLISNLLAGVFPRLPLG